MMNADDVRYTRFIPQSVLDARAKPRLLSGNALRIAQEIETLRFGHSLGGEFRPRRVIAR